MAQKGKEDMEGITQKSPRTLIRVRGLPEFETPHGPPSHPGEVIVGQFNRQVFWLANHPPGRLPDHLDQWHLGPSSSLTAAGPRGNSSNRAAPLFPIKPLRAPDTLDGTFGA